MSPPLPLKPTATLNQTSCTPSHFDLYIDLLLLSPKEKDLFPSKLWLKCIGTCSLNLMWLHVFSKSALERLYVN
jgi:hypothetical protein